MKDLWQTLKDSSLPVLLYGMGNGADKVLSACARKGIPIAGVFASDGFARGNLFHGMRVTDYRTAKESFGEFLVLVCFATSRSTVLENIRRIAAEKKLYVPDLPVAGETLFDSDFFDLHQQELTQARSLLEDDLSKRIFDLAVKSKLTGDLSSLLCGTTTEKEDYETVLHPWRYEVCGDLGAYTGDTVRELLAYCPRLKEIISMEPDPKTFEKLKKNTASLPVLAIHGAAWDREEALLFNASGNRGSGIGAAGTGQIAIKAFPGDKFFENRKADYLKFDVEGAELKALKGFHRTIERDRPELLISCYHRPEDLFVLPAYIKNTYPFYTLYLRRHECIPAWDLNLYAIPKWRPAPLA